MKVNKLFKSKQRDRSYLYYEIEEYEKTVIITFPHIPSYKYIYPEMEIIIDEDIVNGPIQISDYWSMYLVGIAAEEQEDGSFDIVCKIAKIQEILKNIEEIYWEKYVKLLKVDELKHKSFIIANVEI